MKKNKSQWKILQEFFCNRTKLSFGNPKYVMYFLFVIFLVGSFGLVYDLINIEYCFNCSLNFEKVKIFTFNMTNISLSLVTASVIDLIFISKKDIEKDYNQDKNKQNYNFDNLKGNVRFFGLITLIISFIIWILVNNIIESSIIKIILATCSLLFSYWIWWVSNVRNKILSNYDSNIKEIIGGDIDSNTSKVGGHDSNENNSEELKGDISNFITE